ncbi:MAG: hypothetical protein JXD19_11215, partial [Deltaproteobacteria bacterium]|nr:hypothetical protein [Deltaproteobacteria bacterium]
MSESKLLKQMSDRVGRDFNLLFSRVSMYHMDHPTTRDSLERFYKTITEGFQTLSPLSLILNRDQFFIDDELLDTRINTSKMINHFKRAGIQSVSFEKGLSSGELQDFMEVFIDLNDYPTAESLRDALTDRRIVNIKINYVVYRKMTADDEVHRRDQGGPGTDQTSEERTGSIEAVLQKMVAQGVLLDEVEKSLSLASLVRDPATFSNTLIATDLAVYQQDRGRTSQPGTTLAHELERLRHGLGKPDEPTESVDLAQLAQAVFSLRKELLKGIQAQKAMGVLFPNEDKIRQQADELSDQVLMQLMREEYNKGETSIKRLAQILCRLIPQPKELIRLLPKLKEALLEEGMPLSDFLQLLHVIGQELQSEELAGLFHDSAEQIGVSGDDLIEEIRRDPTGAAELIVLAAEIRKGTGDSNALGDLLVDYIERIGCDLALHQAEKRGQEGGRHLREVISTIHRDLVSRIAKKEIDPSILKAIDLSLQQRLEQTVRQVKATWIVRQIPSHTSKQATRNSIMKVLENASDDEEELHG